MHDIQTIDAGGLAAPTAADEDRLLAILRQQDEPAPPSKPGPFDVRPLPCERTCSCWGSPATVGQW